MCAYACVQARVGAEGEGEGRADSLLSVEPVASQSQDAEPKLDAAWPTEHPGAPKDLN